MFRTRFRIRSAANAAVERGKKFLEHVQNMAWSFMAMWIRFRVGGIFKVECFDSNGNLKWTEYAKNGVTDVGIASILNIYFVAGTQITAWYIGLINNSGYTALAAGDTMASHGGWAEAAGSNYSQTNRGTWTPGAPSSGAVVNSTTVDFSMTPASALTVKGLFLCSDNTKGGTTGTLFSTAVFTGGNQIVNSGDTLKTTYTVSGVSS